MLFRFPAILLTGSVAAGGISAYLIPGEPEYIFIEPNSFVEELQLFGVALNVFFWLFIAIGPFIAIKYYTKSIRKGEISHLRGNIFLFWHIRDLDKFYRFNLIWSIFFIGIGFGRLAGIFLIQANLSSLSVILMVSGISILFGLKVFLRTDNKR